MEAEAPLAWRATPEGVYLVSTSAYPVGDDDLDMTVRVRSGTDVSIRSTAAMIAWSSCGSRLRTQVHVEAGARLDWRPEPLVATAGCEHEQLATVHLAEGAHLRWQDVLVLGRAGETSGRLRSRLSIDLAGLPVLRHELAAVERAVWTSPAVMGGNRVAAMVVAVGGGPAPTGQASGEGWVVAPLHQGGVLTLAVAGDVPAAMDRLALGEAVHHHTR